MYTHRLKSRFSIAFACIASHNLFILARDSMVFNRSASVIQLPLSSSEDEYLDIVGIVGLLNSSSACFWMKQVFYPKSTTVKDIDSETGKPESNRYDITATGFYSFPIPNLLTNENYGVRSAAKALDSLASQLTYLMHKEILKLQGRGVIDPFLADHFRNSEIEYLDKRRRMIAHQEELDWEIYKGYALVEEGADDVILADEQQGISAEDRPFSWADDTVPETVPDAWKSIYQKRRALITSIPSIRIAQNVIYKGMALKRP